MVEDINRPDVNGVLPKMEAIKNKVKEITGIPYFKVETDDNLCSSVFVRGSFDPKETWSNGIFHNSRYFIIRIAPKTRYYTPGDELVMEMTSKGNKVNKLRKYTGSVEKVIAKLKEWLVKPYQE